MFGLPGGPPRGPGAVKGRPGMKDRARGSCREVRGPRLGKSTSDVWACPAHKTHIGAWPHGQDQAAIPARGPMSPRSQRAWIGTHGDHA